MPAPNRIAELRKAKGWSQPQLGEAVKPPAHWITISKLERGRMGLTDDWMRRIGEALEVEPAELLPRSRPIAEASLQGEIRDSGVVQLWKEENFQTLGVESGFFINPNAFWLEAKNDVYQPFFPVGSMLKCEWLDSARYAAHQGRICFVALESDNGVLGFLKASGKTDARGYPLTFDVSWPARGSMTDIRPLNIAAVTAIVFPKVPDTQT